MKYTLVFLLFLTLTFDIAEAGKKKKRRAPSASVPKTMSVPPIEEAEVKLVLEEAQIDKFLEWVRAKDAKFEQEHVFFFETPNRELSSKNVFIRLRRNSNETYDSTVKVRASSIAELPGLKPKSKARLACELDHTFQVGSVTSCELKEKSKRVLRSIDSEKVESLLTSDQMKFVRHFVPEIKWQSVKALGRIISSSWNIKDSEKNIDCELWTLPNNQRIIECSSTVKAKDIEKSQKDLLDYFTNQGLNLSNRQSFKTERALEMLFTSVGSDS